VESKTVELVILEIAQWLSAARLVVEVGEMLAKGYRISVR
jgi:hypothetical protein